ncbi:hypothetical protein ACFPT7_09500 [Acidicapsa dinghuensis]|uniref:DUF2768 domain-containing protein n=1 Tax=Acidicapsa dinghuensis TaxID=2218256 RepID=A0ABW1EGN7_9BACT|nr:hypothetical protein [Acidicapsa dinghuensis]
MTLHPSHFSAVLLFSFFVSIVLGITQRDEAKRMFKYGAAAFGLFVGSAIVLSWLMYFMAR